MTERWPPTYDARDLNKSISALLKTDNIKEHFYSAIESDDYFQGDIIALDSGAPVITSDGECAVFGEMKYWLVIGNTCDISRSISQNEWTQIVPIIEVPGVNEELKREFLKYNASRRFYLPLWDESEESTYFADFSMPVTIHKQALHEKTNILARLDYYSWILLNSCLVRFLAREDGRFD